MLLASYPRLAKGATLAILAPAIIAFLTLAPQVWAHKVNVFAWEEGDTVFVEGYYPGGKKARNSLVEVYDSTGTKILEGRTDKKGEFSFKTPKKTDLRIVLTAGMGHKNDFFLSASHGGGFDSSQPAKIEGTEKFSSQIEVDKRQLEIMINQALDRKLESVIKLIRECRREGPSVTEIIGGIGYIFGLFGLVMYFKSRKNKERGQRSEVRGQQNIDKQ